MQKHSSADSDPVANSCTVFTAFFYFFIFIPNADIFIDAFKEKVAIYTREALFNQDIYATHVFPPTFVTFRCKNKLVQSGFASCLVFFPERLY